MKDDWISPFQEKLGNYELDIPVPAPARSRKWLFPVIAGMAAAAALALLLWLPGGKTSAPAGTSLRLIAQAQPVLSQDPAQLPSGHLLANPPAHRTPAPASFNVTNPTETTETPSTLQDPVVTDTPEAPQTPQNPVTPTKPATPVANGPASSQPLFPETDDLPRQRDAHRLSVQVYASPFLQQKTPGIVSPVPYQSVSSAAIALDSWINDSRPAYAYSSSVASLRFPAYSFSDISTHCRLPLKAGLSVRYAFNPRFQLEGGLTYSYHFIDQVVPNGEAEIPFSEYRLHYVGIPLKALVPIVGGKYVHFYGSAGAEAELLASGRRSLHIPTEETVEIEGHPFQLSLLVGAGIEVTLVDRLSLYAEPGAAWHAITPKSVPGYYREHPLSFDFRFGLRFNL